MRRRLLIALGASISTNGALLVASLAYMVAHPSPNAHWPLSHVAQFAAILVSIWAVSLALAIWLVSLATSKMPAPGVMFFVALLIADLVVIMAMSGWLGPWSANPYTLWKDPWGLWRIFVSTFVAGAIFRHFDKRESLAFKP